MAYSVKDKVPQAQGIIDWLDSCNSDTTKEEYDAKLAELQSYMKSPEQGEAQDNEKERNTEPMVEEID